MSINKKGCLHVDLKLQFIHRNNGTFHYPGAIIVIVWEGQFGLVMIYHSQLDGLKSAKGEPLKPVKKRRGCEFESASAFCEKKFIDVST